MKQQIAFSRSYSRASYIKFVALSILNLILEAVTVAWAMAWNDKKGFPFSLRIERDYSIDFSIHLPEG